MHAVVEPQADVHGGTAPTDARAPDLRSAVDAIAASTRANTERFTPSIDLLSSSMAGGDGARQVWGHCLAMLDATV